MCNTNINWSLFYKKYKDQLHEFIEIRQFGSTIIVRKGNTNTCGSSEILKYQDAEEAKIKFNLENASLVNSNFVLYRSGIYDPENFDFSQLTDEIREGARKAFTKIRDSHPNEIINAFALFSDDDAMTIVHVCNSDRARLSKGDDDDFLWNPSEWSYDEGSEYLDIAYRLILTQHQDLPSNINFDDFKAGFIESSITALEQLDNEGFFGSNLLRENTIVLFTISDSDYIDDAVRRLNTPLIYERYRNWYDSWN
jgi:hypothetical protein